MSMPNEDVCPCCGLRKTGREAAFAASDGSANLRMSGQQARSIILNCHALLRHKFRGSPLWSMVGQITGHGCGYSHEICKSANLNPSQECGRKTLEDDSPNKHISDH